MSSNCTNALCCKARRGIIFFLTMLAISPLAGLSQAAELKSHPLISQYSGTQLKKSGVVNYDQIGFPVSQQQIESRSGRISADFFEGDRKTSPREVHENFLDQLNKAGARIRVDCDQLTCARDFVRNLLVNTWMKNRIIDIDIYNLNNKSNYRFISAEIGDQTKPVAIQLLINSDFSGNLEIGQIIQEPLPLTLGKVAINTEWLTQPTSPDVETVLNMKDREGTKDHPLISRYQGTVISEQKILEFDGFRLPEGRDSGGKPLYKNLKGRITTTVYQVPPGQSTLLVFENYLSALDKAGLTPHFRCELSACGSYLLRDIWSDTTTKFRYRPMDINNIHKESDFRMINASMKSGNQLVYVQVSVYQSSAIHTIAIDVVETIAQPTDRVVIDAAYMTDEIKRKGRVVLHGLNFDFNKDTLTPESIPVLDTITTYLEKNPDQDFFVVGHTDSVGDYDFNRSLSDRRAVSVTTALKQRKIPASRLTPAGVGPVSPIANNLDDLGQASNRRVELVLR